MQNGVQAVREISRGIFECHANGTTWIVIDPETWLAQGTPRWTPGRRHEVLAESRFVLPDRTAKLRVQAYVG